MSRVWSAVSVVILAASVASCSTEGTSTGQKSSNLDLSGTWDVVATQNGDTTMGSLTWSAHSISFTSGDETSTVTLDSSGDGTARTSSSQDEVTVHHEGSMDTGAIPFDLGGNWSATDSDHPNKKCTAVVNSSSFTSRCGANQGKADFSASAQRTAKAESIFGELGGTWVFDFDNDNCTVKLVGSKITMSCSRPFGRSGMSFTATVSGDTISGTSSDGVEFTATRR